MVELSLANRVTLDRRASVLGEGAVGAVSHYWRALLAVTSSLNILFLCLGVLLTAIIESEAAGSKAYAMSLRHLADIHQHY